MKFLCLVVILDVVRLFISKNFGILRVRFYCLLVLELTSDLVRCCSSCHNRVVRLINSHQSSEHPMALISEASEGLWRILSIV